MHLSQRKQAQEHDERDNTMLSAIQQPFNTMTCARQAINNMHIGRYKVKQWRGQYILTYVCKSGHAITSVTDHFYGFWAWILERSIFSGGQSPKGPLAWSWAVFWGPLGLQRAPGTPVPWAQKAMDFDDFCHSIGLVCSRAMGSGRNSIWSEKRKKKTF